ncbi:hypothetical protein AB9P05_23700 [Roseivirga sp. BDSF3-8]|uniref:hypothetical protein n=1 Tax=Roseivirga sp. BDSF3-8 TaxID=3241598 RepID=UPI003531E4B9
MRWSKEKVVAIENNKDQLVYQYDDGCKEIYYLREGTLASLTSESDTVNLVFDIQLKVFVNDKEFIISIYQGHSPAADAKCEYYYCKEYGVIYKRHTVWPSYSILKSDTGMVHALVQAVVHISNDSSESIEYELEKTLDRQIEEDF